MIYISIICNARMLSMLKFTLQHYCSFFQKTEYNIQKFKGSIMKNITKFLLLTVMTVFITTNAFANTKPIAFDIYPYSAKVVFEADITNGNTVTIPATFQANTIKVIGTTGNAKIKQFSIKTIEADNNPPAFLKQLANDIDKANNDLNVINSKINGLELAAIILDNMNADNVSPANLAKFIQDVTKMRQTNAYEIDKLKAEKKELEAKIKLLNNNYTNSLPKNWNKSIELEFDATGKGNILFEAYTNAVSWKPEYKLELDTNTGTIRGTLSAKIKQFTGIDWNGSVIFSTNEHRSSANADMLPSLLVEIAQAYAPINVLYRSDVVLDSEMVMDEEMQVEPQVAKSATQQFDTTLSKSYVTTANISGGNSEINIMLENFTINSKLSLNAVPELSQKASIVATIDSLPFTLIANNAELYVDREYSQDIYLPELVAGDSLSIAFGDKNNISVNKSIHAISQGSSWTKGTKAYGYTIEIANGTDKAQQIKLYDRIPLSKNSKIKVENVKISNNGIVDKDGIIEWNTSIPAKQTLKVDVTYTIKYPDDENIILREFRN